MTYQTPGLSREVHFVLPNGQHRTAKVINTNPRNPDTPTLKIELDPFVDSLSLKDVMQLGGNVRLATGYLVAQNVPYDETGQTIGTFHWPERA